MIENQELVGELRARLEAYVEIRFALLFGSRASGREHPGSDLDLAVYLDEKLAPEEQFDLQLGLTNDLSDLGRPDVVILNQAPPLLGHRALQGKLVFNRDRPAYVRYFVRTLAAYHDERPWRRLHERARARRAEEGCFGRP